MATEGSDKPDLTGNWVLERNDENFDKYLQALGMNWFVRKMVSMATVKTDISKDGDKIEIKIQWVHTPMLLHTEKYANHDPMWKRWSSTGIEQSNSQQDKEEYTER